MLSSDSNERLEEMIELTKNAKEAPNGGDMNEIRWAITDSDQSRSFSFKEIRHTDHPQDQRTQPKRATDR